MSTIGVMMSAGRADAKMSSHFGRAEWIMIVNTETQVSTFVKNEAMNGRGAVEIAMREGCADIVFTEIGNGAFEHLEKAGIRGWVAPEQTTGKVALYMFEQLALQPASESTKHREEGHGCCCAKRKGTEVGACCRG